MTASPTTPTYKPPPMPRWSPRPASPSRQLGFSDLALSLSGVGLAVFMVMHMGLLASALLGAATMNALAEFLERYYLLQIGVVGLVPLLLIHSVVSLRKLPTSVRQQWEVVSGIRSLRHLDTWTWALQIGTALAILILTSIHLWVVLTTLPIEAEKSGLRVFQTYWWFYAPFIVVVEAHISIGLYRAAVKWGLLARWPAHLALLAWTAVFLLLGFAILVNFYLLGGAS